MTTPFSNGPDGSAAIDGRASPRAEPAKCPVPHEPRRIITRIAQVGFLFFLVKGLVWIAIAIIAWMGLSAG
jgi:hypothetical protein